MIPWLSFVAAFLLMASTVTFTVGKWTRASIVMVLLCIFYLKGVRDSVTGDVHHRYVALVQILFFLLLSRCGDVLSWDGRRKREARVSEWEASWPIRAAQVYLAFFYFFAIVAKFRVSGWDWFADGGRLQEQLIIRSVRWGLSDEGMPVRNLLSFHVASCKPLVFALSLWVIAFEFLFPLILFVKRNWIKLGFVSAAFVFHIANYVLLDVNFLLFGFVLAVFFDLAAVRRSLADRLVCLEYVKTRQLRLEETWKSLKTRWRHGK